MFGRMRSTMPIRFKPEDFKPPSFTVVCSCGQQTWVRLDSNPWWTADASGWKFGWDRLPGGKLRGWYCGQPEHFGASFIIAEPELKQPQSLTELLGI